jgi:nucleotide-binding universal stress UspA family protein
MILLSYDGSSDARAAIERAAQVTPGADATVLTVWVPFIDSLARAALPGMGLGMVGTYGWAASEETDVANRAGALATATEGAQRATDAGLVATPRAVSLDRDVANTILGVAADVDAEVIVMGTRGLSAMKGFMLGSVSHAVVQHADRAVLVVPSPGLARRRRHEVHRAVTPA